MALVWKKRKKGMTAFLDLRDASGRRHILSLDTPDPVEAQRLYHLKAAEVLAEDPPPKPATLTLADLRTQVLAHVASIPSSKTYRLAFGSLLSVLSPDLRLQAVTRRLIDEWRAKVSLSFKTHTINTYLSRLTAAFERAVEWEYLSRNPFKGVKQGRVPLGASYFHPEELKPVLDALETVVRYGSMYRAGAEVAYFTGLRVGEVVQLRREHITDTHLRVVGKTKSDRFRSVPLTDGARRALASRLQVTTGGWLFPSPKRGPQHHASENNLSRMFKAACCQVGVKGHFHMLRHSFAARHLSAGVPILTVSQWLGHSSVSTTQEHYGHLVPGSQDAFIHLAPDTI